MTDTVPDFAPSIERIELFQLCGDLPLDGVKKVLEYAREVKFAIDAPESVEPVAKKLKIASFRKLQPEGF